jgi:UDP-N-acetylenolpyruvoylglucosamine reductase
MRLLLVSLIATSLYAEETSIIDSLNQILPKTVFSIDHKHRTKDIIQAYDLLKREKPTLKVALRTTEGSFFENVTELTAASGGTLLFVKNLSKHGSKYTILPVEEIAEINYSN